MKTQYVWCECCEEFVWCCIEKTPVYVSYCVKCGKTGLVKEK